MSLEDNSCPDCGAIVQIGEWPLPCGGRGHTLGSFWRGDAQVHASEKVVINRNIHTGDISIPGRVDRPLHPKMAAAGYVREVLDTTTQVKQLEKEKGLIHEAGNYSDSTSTAARDTGAR